MRRKGKGALPQTPPRATVPCGSHTGCKVNPAWKTQMANATKCGDQDKDKCQQQTNSQGTTSQALPPRHTGHPSGHAPCPLGALG